MTDRVSALRLSGQDPILSPEQRAADLVQQMTLGEKAPQLVNQARATQTAQRSGVRLVECGLHGVAVDGATKGPEPIGLAAHFDEVAQRRDGNLADLPCKRHIRYLRFPTRWLRTKSTR